MRIRNKALFLDRDGVINIDHGYVVEVDDFEFIEGIFQLCQFYQSNGFKIIIITNQSGIARGFYNEIQFKKLMTWMCEKFSEKDIIISGIYYCPHHPTKGIFPFRKQCSCRKPLPGLILNAINDHDIDPKESIIIGDKISDIEAAMAAGVGVKILYDNKINQKDLDSLIADYTVNSLNDCRYISSKK